MNRFRVILKSDFLQIRFNNLIIACSTSTNAQLWSPVICCQCISLKVGTHHCFIKAMTVRFFNVFVNWRPASFIFKTIRIECEILGFFSFYCLCLFYILHAITCFDIIFTFFETKMQVSVFSINVKVVTNPRKGALSRWNIYIYIYI